jgi:hypothetical protein
MSPLTQQLLVTVFGALLVAIFGLMGYMAKRLGKLVNDVSILQTQMSPFWASVERIVSKDLHHPSPRYAEMDGLLEKLDVLTITPDERDRLRVLLVERSEDQHDDITESQRQKARLMIPLMDVVTEEAKGKQP